jgi:tRNA-Thr(GGU) m(6)t(6)A37 methyltransferase TsaA
MDLSHIDLTAIGVVRTDAEKVPRHWTISDQVGRLELEQEYVAGLKDIQPGQRLVVIFLFHQSRGFSFDHLQHKPPHLDEVRGIFSTCSPVRPNPIGLSVVTVEKIEGPVLTVKGIDMLDGTPILDLKPYIENH